MSKTRMILIGLGLMFVAVVVGALPRSEGYSSFGFGVVGRVDVECGSVFSREQRVDFADYSEELLYYEDKRVYGEPNVFEGKTETQVCDGALQTTKTVSILAAIAGAAFFVAGLFRSSTTGSSAAEMKRFAPKSPQTSGRRGGTNDSSGPDPTSAFANLSNELDESTMRVLEWLEFARAKVRPYIAPRLFLGASLAYLIAILQSEWSFGSWGSVSYLKGILLITGVAAVVGFNGKSRVADLVAAIGAAYVLGDGLWRLAGGEHIGPVWARMMLFVADVAILYGLIQFFSERGRPADRRAALDSHAQVVLVGSGVVTLILIVVGRQRGFSDWISEVTYVTGFWVLFMAAVVVALLLRSKDLLMFVAAATGLRLILLFVGWHRYTSGASPTLAKLGLAAVAGFAGWQWYLLHNGALLDDAPIGAGPASAASAKKRPSDQPLVDASAPIPIGRQTTPAPPEAMAFTGVALFDGGAAVEFDRHLVLGRNPTAPDGVANVVEYALDDSTFTVSKTHLLVGIEGDELWVEDLHSANGTELMVGDELVAIRPQMRRFVGDGQVIRVGEMRMTLMTRQEE